MTGETKASAGDFTGLKTLFAQVNAGIGGLPWVVEADSGKPVLRGRKGLIAAGYLATWKEFDLIAEMANALPALIERAEDIPDVQGERTYTQAEVDSILRAAFPRSWGDKDDQHSAAIEAAHPLKTKDHDTFSVAVDMVGNRHSKYALIELTNWLLRRAQQAEEALAPFAEAAAHLHPSQPDDGETLDGFSARDFRRAAEVYARRPG